MNHDFKICAEDIVRLRKPDSRLRRGRYKIIQSYAGAPVSANPERYNARWAQEAEVNPAMTSNQQLFTVKSLCGEYLFNVPLNQIRSIEVDGVAIRNPGYRRKSAGQNGAKPQVA